HCSSLTQNPGYSLFRRQAPHSSLVGTISSCARTTAPSFNTHPRATLTRNPIAVCAEEGDTHETYTLETNRPCYFRVLPGADASRQQGITKTRPRLHWHG